MTGALLRAINNYLMSLPSYTAMLRPWLMQEIERRRANAERLAFVKRALR